MFKRITMKSCRRLILLLLLACLSFSMMASAATYYLPYDTSSLMQGQPGSGCCWATAAYNSVIMVKGSVRGTVRDGVYAAHGNYDLTVGGNTADIVAAARYFSNNQYTYTQYQYSISYSRIVTAIQNRKAVIAGGMRSGGTSYAQGHVVSINQVDTNSQYLGFIDPWYQEAASRRRFASYSSFCDGTGNNGYIYNCTVVQN